MKRSNWKFFSYDYWTLQYLKKCLKLKEKNIFLNKRSLNVLPIFIDKSIKIHNGFDYKPVKLNFASLGHKIGSFNLTRKQYLYKKGLNLKKKK